LRFLALVSHLSTLPPIPSTPLSLHDALPILEQLARSGQRHAGEVALQVICIARAIGRRVEHRVDPVEHVAWAKSGGEIAALAAADRKSTRLNSSHVKISYAVFVLKKKKKQVR